MLKCVRDPDHTRLGDRIVRHRKADSSQLSIGWVGPWVRLGWVGSTIAKVLKFERIMLMNLKHG